MRGAPKEDDDISRIRKNPVMMFGARDKVNQEIDNYSYLAKLKAQEIAAKQLAEDPNIYDYDNFVDENQNKRKQQEIAKKQDRQSKYMDGILSNLEKKKYEAQLVADRIKAKKIEEDKKINGEAEVHYTEAYKKRLTEIKKYTQKEEDQEEYNKQHTVSEEKGLGSFYKHLYDTNQFAGGNRLNPAEEKQLKNKLQEEMQLRQKQRQQFNKETIIKPRSRSRSAEKKTQKRQRDEEIKEVLPAIVEVKPTLEDTKKEREQKAMGARERYLQRQKEQQEKQLEQSKLEQQVQSTE